MDEKGQSNGPNKGTQPVPMRTRSEKRTSQNLCPHQEERLTEYGVVLSTQNQYSKTQAVEQRWNKQAKYQNRRKNMLLLGCCSSSSSRHADHSTPTHTNTVAHKIWCLGDSTESGCLTLVCQHNLPSNSSHRKHTRARTHTHSLTHMQRHTLRRALLQH